MSTLSPGEDLTPVVGAQTDVAPLGRTPPKPTHELTAVEDGDPVHWHAVAESDEFKALLRDKLRFIVPATAFFIVYYFALPVLVGYFPKVMERKVWGNVNIAYLFALSQFFMAWALAGVYVVVAAGWDKKAAALLARIQKH